jgi:16S rRNA (cytidine1402-2'-O)-methyltransferase
MSNFYVIGTPIGNLEDVSLRALSVLANVNFILAEDTRVTKRLLERYNIQVKKLISYHQHSDIKKINQIIKIAQSEDIVMVSDAGTPGISDPGGKLVEVLVEKVPNLRIIPIPGPFAAAAALSISGFPADKFVFMGFPPHKKGRETFFKRLASYDQTVVFYESPHRILKALGSLAPFMRKLVVARELTKQFETIYGGGAEEILRELGDKPRGEFVVIVSSSKL